jgi:hypothetical protein
VSYIFHSTSFLNVSSPCHTLFRHKISSFSGCGIRSFYISIDSSMSTVMNFIRLVATLILVFFYDIHVPGVYYLLVSLLSFNRLSVLFNIPLRTEQTQGFRYSLRMRLTSTTSDAVNFFYGQQTFVISSFYLKFLKLVTEFLFFHIFVFSQEIFTLFVNLCT